MSKGKWDFWTPDLTAELIRHYRTGETFDSIAKQMNMTRNKAAGRINRLIESGRLERRGASSSQARWSLKKHNKPFDPKEELGCFLNPLK